MDCPSEENLIRMKLAEVDSVHHLDFDISNRLLTVFHDEGLGQIESEIASLNLGGQRRSTTQAQQTVFEETNNQSKLLWSVLGINFFFFLLELTTGLVSKSMGLIADSLDMLADAFVYGISLFAVGGTSSRKKGIAQLAGYFQLLLAIIGFVEVCRRFFIVQQRPDYTIMIIVSLLALVANGLCLYLLQRSKNKSDAHIQASLIFTSNDVIINLGVIVAGLLVLGLNSSIPDLVIGAIVFVLVVKGAIRILRLS